MPSHPDPAWVAVGRACCDLVIDSGLLGDDRIQALTFAQQLIFHPVRFVTPETAAAASAPPSAP